MHTQRKMEKNNKDIVRSTDLGESDGATDVCTSQPGGRNLSFDELQHLFKFVDLREVIICEQFGSVFREAAEHHYYKKYKTFVVSHELLSQLDAQAADPRQLHLYATIWKHVQRILPFSIGTETYSEKMKQLIEMLLRVGPYVQELTFSMDKFTSTQVSQISRLLETYCTNVRQMTYRGPTECSSRELSKMQLPCPLTIQSVAFHNILQHTDSSLKKVIYCGPRLKSMTFDHMRMSGSCLKWSVGLVSLSLVNVRQLQGEKLVRCIRQNSTTLKRFHLENKLVSNEVLPIDPEDLLLHIPRIRSLRLRGREYGKFSRVNDLSFLTELELSCSNATELNKFFIFMPEANIIERLNVTINCELSDGALDGFSRFRHLKVLKLRLTSGGQYQLNDICRNFGEIPTITTFELINFNEIDCNLTEPCYFLKNVENLSVTLHKNAANLKAIAGLHKLKVLFLHLSTCTKDSFVQKNNDELNELLQTISRKGGLRSLKLHLSNQIQLTASTVLALSKVDTLKELAYRGCVAENSFFYDLGIMQNLTSLTYVMTPRSSLPGAVTLNPNKMREVVERAKNLKLFTIVLNVVNDVDTPFRVLIDVRPGFQVRVKDKELYVKECFSDENLLEEMLEN